MRCPPASASVAAKARPSATASAAKREVPTIPRMSYSRRIVGSKRCAIARGLLAVGLEDLAQTRPELRVLEAERDIGFEKAEFVAAIEAASCRAQSKEFLARGDQPGKPVGQLDLVAGAGPGLFEMREDFGLDDVAADGRQVRRRLFRLR